MSNLDLNRLPLPYGILIDRNQPVTFQFDQQTFQGYAGDITLNAGDRVEVPKASSKDNQMLKVAGAVLLLFILFGR